MSEMGRFFPLTNDQNIGRLTYSAASFSAFLHISSNHPIAAESGEHPVPAIIEHLQHYSLQGLVLQQVPCDTTSRKSGEGIEVHACSASKRSWYILVLLEKTSASFR